ncbi:MAG: hypothetical protein ACPL5F_01570 [Moorellaceae bacterium]
MKIKIDRMGVRVTFTEDVLGSWPADENLFTRYVSSKAPSPWLGEEEQKSLRERSEETGLTVFPQDEKGVHFYNYHLKGFIKEAGNVLKGAEAVGIKNLRSKIDNYVFVQPRRIYFYRDGAVVKEPDDILERPLRAQTAQGPRVTLAASERVKAPVTLEFVIEVIENKEVTLDILRTLLDYGSYKGLGQWRNGGWGSFEWEEVDLERFTLAKLSVA